MHDECAAFAQLGHLLIHALDLGVELHVALKLNRHVPIALVEAGAELEVVLAQSLEFRLRLLLLVHRGLGCWATHVANVNAPCIMSQGLEGACGMSGKSKLLRISAIMVRVTQKEDERLRKCADKSGLSL